MKRNKGLVALLEAAARARFKDTAAVTQQSCLACVQNYSGTRDTYMLTVLFP